MQVKLKKEVKGKNGIYPADVWLDVTEIEGFYYVSIPGNPSMHLKRVARSNIKEWKT